MRPIPYYVKALAFGLVPYLIAVTGWHALLYGGDFLEYGDFRSFYAVGVIFRSNPQRVYDLELQDQIQRQLTSKKDAITQPYIHPPFETYLFGHFARFPYRIAYFFWLLLNVLVLGVSVLLLWPYLRKFQAVYSWLPYVLFLAFLPVGIVLLEGQDSLLLLLLLAAAFRSLDQSEEFKAGLLLGLGLFRFQLVLPILFLFLAWKRWRVALGGTVSSALLALASLRFLPSYLDAIQNRAFGASTQVLRYMANLHGLLKLPWLVVVVSLIALAASFRAGREKMAANQLLLAIVTASLVSYYQLPHDLVILLVPIVILLGETLGAEADGSAGRWLFRAAALAFVAPVVMTQAPEHFFLAAVPLLLFYSVFLSSLAPQRDQKSNVEERTQVTRLANA